MLERTLPQPNNQRDSIMLVYDPEDMLPVRKSEEDFMNIPPESDGTELIDGNMLRQNKSIFVGIPKTKSPVDQEVGDEKNSRYEELDTWIWVVLVICWFSLILIIGKCCWDRCNEGGVPVGELGGPGCFAIVLDIAMEPRYHRSQPNPRGHLNLIHVRNESEHRVIVRSESELNKAKDRLQKIQKLIDEIPVTKDLDTIKKKIKGINMDTKKIKSKN